MGRVSARTESVRLLRRFGRTVRRGRLRCLVAAGRTSSSGPSPALGANQSTIRSDRAPLGRGDLCAAQSPGNRCQGGGLITSRRRRFLPDCAESHASRKPLTSCRDSLIFASKDFRASWSGNISTTNALADPIRHVLSLAGLKGCDRPVYLRPLRHQFARCLDQQRSELALQRLRARLHARRRRGDP
jgi:hypothetical protein